MKVFETPVVERTDDRRAATGSAALFQFEVPAELVHARPLHLPDQHHRRGRGQVRVPAHAVRREVSVLWPPSSSMTASAACAVGSCDSCCGGIVDGRLLFAPLQGGLARTVLGRHGYDPSDLDTVYVFADRRAPDRPRRPDSARWGGSERVLSKSRAILHALGCARRRVARPGAVGLARSRGAGRRGVRCRREEALSHLREAGELPDPSSRVARALHRGRQGRDVFHHRVNGVSGGKTKATEEHGLRQTTPKLKTRPRHGVSHSSAGRDENMNDFDYGIFGDDRAPAVADAGIAVDHDADVARPPVRALAGRPRRARREDSPRASSSISSKARRGSASCRFT